MPGVKQAHWNVKGPHFMALHELFDQVNEAVWSTWTISPSGRSSLAAWPRERPGWWHDRVRWRSTPPRRWRAAATSRRYRLYWRFSASWQCVRNPSRAHLYRELEGHNAARYCRSEDLRPRRPLLQGLGKGPTRHLQPRLAAERGRLGRPDAFSGCPRIPLHRP